MVMKPEKDDFKEIEDLLKAQKIKKAPEELLNNFSESVMSKIEMENGKVYKIYQNDNAQQPYSALTASSSEKFSNLKASHFVRYPRTWGNAIQIFCQNWIKTEEIWTSPSKTEEQKLISKMSLKDPSIPSFRYLNK